MARMLADQADKKAKLVRSSDRSPDENTALVGTATAHIRFLKHGFKTQRGPENIDADQEPNPGAPLRPFWSLLKSRMASFGRMSETAKSIAARDKCCAPISIL